VYNLFSSQNSGYPLVLAPGEGFNITNGISIANTTAVALTVVVDVLEVATPWS
jgi:hypothetical protein